MKIEVLIPSPGESIYEVVLYKWLVKDGSFVEKDTELAEIESDKATLTLVAEQSGYVKFLVAEGQKVSVGEVACIIETENVENNNINKYKTQQVNNKAKKEYVKITPLAKKIAESYQLDINKLKTSDIQRIRAENVKFYLSEKTTNQETTNFQNRETIIELSSLRKKLSERLLQAKNTTAMLTTFNEANMAKILDIRNNYKEQFLNKHGIKLGLMGFFSLAAIRALKEFPNVNSCLKGNKLTLYHYVDLSIAVQTDKGLVVPVIRDADKKSLAEIEKEIFVLAEKARNKKISISELEGGTFSITNGGVFGSLLATPLLNFPQTAILGMHAIQERPIVENQQIVARPMMYIALSYDHRVLDGKDSILFLKRIKELIENPKILIEDNSIEKFLSL